MTTRRLETRAREARATHERTGEWEARLTGRMLSRVLSEWDAHGDTCEPSDHAAQSDRVACARGEH